MGRLAIAWSVVFACGRVGFDPVVTAGDPPDDSLQGSQGDGGATDSPSPIDNCMYMPCGVSMEACCAAGTTTCVPAGSCADIVVPCDLTNNNGCNMLERCCTNGTVIFCTPALCTA